MSEPNPDHFEMRRLESLSNTIFGVAMTLLAYDLPKASQFQNAPDWSDLYRLYAGRLSGLILSFIIAGIFWLGHQRRLARQPYGSRNVVFLNLLFLLSIILLPVTNGLYGSYGLHNTVAALYGLHLTVIAMLNAGLWWLVNRGDWRDPAFAGAVFAILVFLPGTVVAWLAPQYARYLWFLAFGGLFARQLFRMSPKAE
ncbi:MAG TPA: TMEM175 family protein [Bradyrhizobium sp.]|nr:TMEM175 family protein [Bradyrhizobium sp.]